MQKGYVQRHATKTRVLLGQVIPLSARQTIGPSTPIFGTRFFPLSLLRLAQQILLRRVVGLAVIYIDTHAQKYLEAAFSAQPDSVARFSSPRLPPPTCRNTDGPRSTSLHSQHHNTPTCLVATFSHPLYDLTHLAPLPRGGDEGALHRRRIGERHHLHLTRAVGDVLGLVVVPRKGGTMVLDVLYYGDLTRSQLDLLTLLLVVYRPAMSWRGEEGVPLILVVGVDVLVDRIQRFRTHDLLAIQVVTNVIVFIVPLYRNVTDRISRFLHVSRITLHLLRHLRRNHLN